MMERNQMKDFEKCKWAESCGYDICVPEYCSEYEGMEMNNADRIRELSDRQLANLLAETYVTGAKHASTYGVIKNHTAEEFVHHKVYCEYMRWLRQTATEDSICSD